MNFLIWILVIAFFGAIFSDLLQEARKPPPAPPPPKEPEPPVFNFHTQVNMKEEYHTHNTMHVTVVKAVPREEDSGPTAE